MLITHAGASVVTDATLEALPAPVARGRIHQPVPHAALVRGLRQAALARGFVVTRQELALNHSGHRLFGVMDLDAAAGSARPEDGQFSIGLRNSTDESLGIRLVAGLRITVCDNLLMAGDMLALKRRNTLGLDLSAALTDAFDRYLEHAHTLEGHVAEMKTATLTNMQAKARLFDIFAHKVLPLRLFAPACRNYFAPDEAMTDCLGNTQWALHNALTRTVKRLPPSRAFTAAVAIGRVFGLTQHVH